jgi:hypothetical protein
MKKYMRLLYEVGMKIVPSPRGCYEKLGVNPCGVLPVAPEIQDVPLVMTFCGPWAQKFKLLL